MSYLKTQIQLFKMANQCQLPTKTFKTYMTKGSKMGQETPEKRSNSS